MGKICVIGSLNMDIAIHTPRLPAMGETIIGSGFMTIPGGKGANQAVAAARLGGDVTMVGHVGDDAFGNSLKQNLQANGVDVRHVKTMRNTPTGIAVIVIKDGNNFIILDSGANFTIKAKDIMEVENVIKESDMLLLQMEIPQEAIEQAVDIANKYGVKVLLNPAPARNMSDDFLAKVDIITPNESECEYIAGMALESIKDAEEAVKYLRGKGIGQVVVTLGGRGVVYNSGDRVLYKPVPEVRVVDTTAAGDSFTGALAVALTNGKSIDEAVDFANIVGTLTVMKKGAQTSLPYIQEVEEFLRGV
ncbi:MAG: ribokinase [Bacillota bacterium]